MKIKKSIISIFFAIAIAFSAVNLCGISTYAEVKSDDEVCYEHEVPACNGEEDMIMPLSTSPANTSYDTFFEAYYANLTKNFGFNSHGTCAYIALSLILSYYDTYLNDTIVPKNYDVISEGTETNMNIRQNSPGTLNDRAASYDANGYLTDNYNYYLNLKEISDGENASLHAKLVTMGYNLGFYGSYNNYQFSIGYDKVLTLANTYLKNLGYLENTNYKVSSKRSDSDTVKKYVISQIDKGIPVWVHFYNGAGTGGHAAVAYAHDGDTVYFHSGWHSGSTMRTMEDMGYIEYYSACSIEFNFVHSHTNNYMVDSNSYCYCSHDIIAYKSLHEFTYRVVIREPDKHKATCTCGYTKTAAHSWTTYATTEPGNWVKCQFCGFVKKLGSGEIVPGIITKVGDEDMLYTIPTVPETDNLLPMFDMRQHDGE